MHTPGATELNLGFTLYQLPVGASLHVYAEDEDYYEGPYTAGDNEVHGQLWLPVTPGDRAVVEVHVPAYTGVQPALQLTHVGYGYRDAFFQRGTDFAEGRFPGSCNNDVICPVADLWRDEVQSVARYSISGVALCTGSMVIDVPRTFRPLFYSAFHCGVTALTAPTCVYYWNYHSPSCGQLCCGSLSDNQSGAFYLAGRDDQDFHLVELNQMPLPEWNIYWAGWDATDDASVFSCVGIHHPQGDPKAISFNDDPLTKISNCTSVTLSTHWRVNNWEDGTTEPGSSGSGIWDEATHRIVGTLSGGSAACPDLNGSDCYGRTGVAWEGVSLVDRLSDHLDPEGTGTLVMDGSFPGPVSVGQAIPAAPIATLAQNRPNPFNPRTTIGFSLDAAGPATLSIFDAAGRHVATLLERGLDSGRHEVVWDGVDDEGRQVAAGLYFYQLDAGGERVVRRMGVVR